jgi:PAS domain-containing protein
MYSLSHDRIINEESLDNILKNAFELAEMGAWSCDLRTERLSWTPAVFDMFGLPRDRTVDRRDVVAMYAEPCRRMLERLCGRDCEQDDLCPGGTDHPPGWQCPGGSV